MTTVSPSDILNHRKWRSASGLVGCKDGSDAPLSSLRGISWRPADPMNPSCFCHDCRSEWDSDGVIDAELVNSGHKMACYTYNSLLEKPTYPVLPTRTNGGGIPPPLDIPPLSATTFEEIPTSIPAPRNRDIMNETNEVRLRNDLFEYLMKLEDDLINMMDTKRNIFPDMPNRDLLIEKIMAAEGRLRDKIDSIRALLKDM